MPKNIKSVKNNKLTKEELAILKYVETGRGKSLPNVKKEIEKYRKIFQENVAKRKAISLRIMENDLLKIKAKALAEGMPYQTLISSIIHKYVNGDLVVR